VTIEIQCDYSSVSPQELIQKVLPEYGIGNVVDCLFWGRGANDNYVVSTDESRYSLRIYRHQIHTRDEIDFEVAALNHLHNEGFPVAFPIALKSGGYITEIAAPEGIRYVLLTAYAEGEQPKYDSPDDFVLTGKSVANLHQSTDGFRTHHKKRDIDLKAFTHDCFKSIEPHLSHRPEELLQLTQFLETASKAIQQVSVDEMDFGFCHGDVHGGNAHLHEGVLRHFDFEECGLGFRVFDLATFKWGAVLDAAPPERWSSFVEGYESVRKISAADLELVDTFVLLRHIWLIAFHMRNASDFGGELLSDRYIDRQWKNLRRFSSEGIGAEMKSEEGYAVVVRTIDGGSAAISKQIEAKDRILGVGDGEDGEIVDIKDMPLDDVVDLIRGPKGTTVRLKIQSDDADSEAATKLVSLVRDKVAP